MPSITVENYLKTLYLQQPAGDELVAMGQLAAAMGVTPGTATSMVKALEESGLVEYEPRGGVRLSDHGEKLALHVLRRHRLIELFLVEVLGLDWAEVHQEAEELEHAISDKVLQRIDQMLGQPTTDPHGDPIPSARGKVQRVRHTSLAECAPSQSATVARVTDQNPAFLQFADQHRLRPGCEVVVRHRDDAAEAITVQPGGGPPVTLALAAAAKILVSPAV